MDNAENSGDTAKKPRGRPFKKGQSGNPGGRPKLPEEFVELARSRSVDALNYLIDAINDENLPPNARIRAAETIIAYGYGKPSQSIDLSGRDNKAIEISVKYE